MDQIHFDARLLPPQEAFDSWRVGLSDFALSRPQGDAAFDGRSTITSLGPIIISESWLPALRFVRTNEMVLADGHDLWSLSLQLKGGLWGDADGKPFKAGPGQIALFSHTRPCEIHTKPSQTIVLAIPGSVLRGVDPAATHGMLPDTAATNS